MGGFGIYLKNHYSGEISAENLEVQSSIVARNWPILAYFYLGPIETLWECSLLLLVLKLRSLFKTCKLLKPIQLYFVQHIHLYTRR